MKKHLLGFLLLVVLSATLHAAPDMKDFTYKDYLMGYSMPGDPEASTQTVDSALGQIVIHAFILEKGKNAIMVMVNVYPDKVLETPPSKLLEAGRDGAINSIKGKLVSEKKISIDNNPGLEFEFTSAEYHGKYRIYLVGTRLYQLGSLAANGDPLMPGTAEFMASFHLLKP